MRYVAELNWAGHQKNEYHSFFEPNFSLTIEKIIIKFAHFFIN